MVSIDSIKLYVVAFTRLYDKIYILYKVFIYIMEEKIRILLQEYGLDETEIKVYSHLVANKELTAYKIAKELRIHRSTCYDVLDRLAQKGFVSKISKDNTMHFISNNINRVLSSLKDKETILNNLIPELQRLEQVGENKLYLLEGAEGQKQFNFKLFSLAKEGKISFCYIIGNTYATNLSSNIFIERLIREFKETKLKRKIECKAIWDKRFENDPLIKQYSALGENRVMKDIPSKVGTIIFDGYIAFLYTMDKPYCIEIQNVQVSDELRSYFNHLWTISSKIK